MDMEIQIAENIRALRHKNGMTQEQLAEALGVTAGAVYKWENGRSMPELPLLLEMAELFAISTDALLGYEMRSGDREQTINRLREYTHNRRAAGALEEAERALKKYPNTFEIVYRCAVLYGVRAVEEINRCHARRALDLYRHALLLLSQNTDESISALSIQCRIAELYALMGEDEKAVALLKKHNPCGMNNARIGALLAADCNRPEEALPYLSDGMMDFFMLLEQISVGYTNVFMKQKDYASMLHILLWAMECSRRLKIPGKTSFLDKQDAGYLLFCGEACLFLNEPEKAKGYIRRAIALAEAFDAAPDYRCSSIRFVGMDTEGTFHDTLGKTAMQALQNHINEENNPAFTALWEEMLHEKG